MDIDFEIASICEHPQFVPTLASWHFEQWGKLYPGATIQRYLDRLSDHTKQDAIPSTFVAHSAGQVVGSASLVHHDLANRDDLKHLTPWLASVFVAPEYRGQGIGSTLVRHVTGQVLMLDIETYYLFTYDQQQLYASLGWERLDESENQGLPITIMKWTAPQDDAPIVNGQWRTR